MVTVFDPSGAFLNVQSLLLAIHIVVEQHPALVNFERISRSLCAEGSRQQQKKTNGYKSDHKNRSTQLQNYGLCARISTFFARKQLLYITLKRKKIVPFYKVCCQCGS